MCLPINVFIINWLPLATVLGAIALGYHKNIREKNLPKAKSFLLIGLIITGLYIFRIQVGIQLIELFQ